MQYDSLYVHYELHKDLLTVTYKTQLHIDKAAAKDIVCSRVLFTSGKNVSVLILSQGVISMTKEAREYLASAEATAGIRASAIVTGSVFSSFLGNFFMKVNKPSMPVKIFSDRDRAKTWLQQFTGD